MFLTCSSPLCHVVARSRTLPDSGGRGRALPAAGRAALRPRDPAAAPATGCFAALSGTRRQATTGHPDTHGQLPVPLPGGAVRASGLSKQELAPFGEVAPSSLQPRHACRAVGNQNARSGHLAEPGHGHGNKGTRVEPTALLFWNRRREGRNAGRPRLHSWACKTQSKPGTGFDLQENDGRNSPLENSGLCRGTQPPPQEGLGGTGPGTAGAGTRG